MLWVIQSVIRIPLSHMPPAHAKLHLRVAMIFTGTAGLLECSLFQVLGKLFPANLPNPAIILLISSCIEYAEMVHKKVLC